MPNRGLRIVGLGDSTTAGTPQFLSPVESPPNGRGNPESQYAYWMMKIHPEWLVLNRGINGERSDQISERFRRDVLKAEPDYVIILAGVNDIFQGYPPDHVKQNLSSMYGSALMEGIVPVAASILPYNTMSTRAFESIRGLNNWVESTAESLQMPFCDTYSAVVNPEDPTKLSASPDSLHPDVSGYRRMGEALVSTIEAHLDRSKMPLSR